MLALGLAGLTPPQGKKGQSIVNSIKSTAVDRAEAIVRWHVQGTVKAMRKQLVSKIYRCDVCY